MIAVASNPSDVVLPQAYRDKHFGNVAQWRITNGRAYTVVGLIVYSGVVLILVQDDIGRPAFLPITAFHRFDGNIPSDWSAKVLSDTITAIGPPFLVGEKGAFNDFVDGDPGRARLFYQYLASSGSQ